MNKNAEIERINEMFAKGALSELEYNLLMTNLSNDYSKSDVDQTDNQLNRNKEKIKPPQKLLSKEGGQEKKSLIEINVNSGNERKPSINDQNENVFIDQGHIDQYVANSEDFWYVFHQSLSAPQSLWNEYQNVSETEWSNINQRDIAASAHLKFLFQFPILKGEYVIAFYSGLILTNYRLLINDSAAGAPVIPLSNLIKYSSNGNIKYTLNGKTFNLSYDNFIEKTIVDNAIGRNELRNLSREQLFILEKSKFDLKKLNSSLDIPEIQFITKDSGEQATSNINQWEEGNDLTLKLFKGAIFMAVLVAIVVGSRLESWVTFFIIAAITLSSVIFLPSKIYEVSKRNLTLIGFITLFALVNFIPFGTHNNNTNNSSTTSTSTDDRAYYKCRYCGTEVFERQGQNGITCYTLEPDGIGVLTMYGGSRYDVYCSEACAIKGKLVGYDYTEH